MRVCARAHVRTMQCCCKSFAKDGYRCFLLSISTKERCIRKELNVFTNKLCIGFLDEKCRQKLRCAGLFIDRSKEYGVIRNPEYIHTRMENA